VTPPIGSRAVAFHASGAISIQETDAALPLADSVSHGAAHRRVADHVDVRRLLLDAFRSHASLATAPVGEERRHHPLRPPIWPPLASFPHMSPRGYPF
jgi:hypothetical protein